MKKLRANAGASGRSLPDAAPSWELREPQSKQSGSSKPREQARAAVGDPHIVAASGPPSTRRKPEPAPTRPEKAAVDTFSTIRVVADRLDVCDRTVRRWIERRKLVAHQFGGVIRISASELGGFAAWARRGGSPAHPRNPFDEEFHSAEGVAEILNVCLRTVRRRIKTGALIAHDFDGIIRVAESDLRDFIDRSRRE